MARARNIKPSFFTNELLGTEDPMVSLTFAGLWCLADKMGVLEDRPLRIKAELFPYRDSLDVNGYLTVLARLGFIVRYRNEGKRFIQVKNFRKHQSPHHTEKAKGFPFPNDSNSLILADNGYETVEDALPHSGYQVPERSDSLIPDSLIPDSGFTDTSDNGDAPVAKRGKRSKDEQPKDELEQSFDQFWAAYPNRKAKAKAKAAWGKIKPDETLLGIILVALEFQKKSPDWVKDGGQFVPHPTTWLNGKRWEDEIADRQPAQSRHTGFAERDYSEGLFEREDGTHGF